MLIVWVAGNWAGGTFLQTYASNVFKADFETGDTSAFTSIVETPEFGEVTVQSAVAHGTYAGNCTVTYSADDYVEAYCLKQFTTSYNNISHQLSFYIHTFTGGRFDLIGLKGVGQWMVFVGLESPSRTLSLWHSGENGIINNMSTTTVGLGEWHTLRVEFVADIDASGDGSIKVYLDNSEVQDLTQTALTHEWYASIEAITTGCDNGVYTSTTVFIDDVETNVAEEAPEPEVLTVNVNPTSTSVPLGTSASFIVNVQGGATPYTFQWYQDDVVLTEETSSLTVTPLSTGTYVISVTVTDSNNDFASDSATLIITEGTATYYSLTIQENVGGTTSPKEGTYSYVENSEVTLTAIPDTGYEFLYWAIDGEVYKTIEVTVIMNGDHTAQVHFQTAPTNTMLYFNVGMSVCVAALLIVGRYKKAI